MYYNNFKLLTEMLQMYYIENSAWIFLNVSNPVKLNNRYYKIVDGVFIKNQSRVKIVFTKHAIWRMTNRFPIESKYKLIKKIGNKLISEYINRTDNCENELIFVDNVLSTRGEMLVAVSGSYTNGIYKLVVKTVMPRKYKSQ